MVIEWLHQKPFQLNKRISFQLTINAISTLGFSNIPFFKIAFFIFHISNFRFSYFQFSYFDFSIFDFWFFDFHFFNFHFFNFDFWFFKIQLLKDEWIISKQPETIRRNNNEKTNKRKPFYNSVNHFVIR